MGGCKTETFENVYNPATGDVLARVPHSTSEDVADAVTAAKEAFKIWQKVSIPKRAKILSNTNNYWLSTKKNLGESSLKRTEKPWRSSCWSWTRYWKRWICCWCADFDDGRFIVISGHWCRSHELSLSNWVVGGITPFNFPMMVPCWMFPMAVATGNTFILKPSEKTPLTSQRLVELFKKRAYRMACSTSLMVRLMLLMAF